MVLQFGSSDSWSCSLQEVRDQGSRIEGRRFVIGDFEGFRKSAFRAISITPGALKPPHLDKKTQRNLYIYIYSQFLNLPQLVQASEVDVELVVAAELVVTAALVVTVVTGTCFIVFGGGGGSESFGGLGLWGGGGGGGGSIPAQDFKVQGNPETLKNFLMGVWMGPRAWSLEIWGLGFVGLGFRV